MNVMKVIYKDRNNYLARSIRQIEVTVAEL